MSTGGATTGCGAADVGDSAVGVGTNKNSGALQVQASADSIRGNTMSIKCLCACILFPFSKGG